LCALWMGVDAANILRTDDLFLLIVPSNTWACMAPLRPLSLLIFYGEWWH
jgi:hypothetical protein